MKRSAVYWAVLAAIAATVSRAEEARSGPELLVIGPVESIDVSTRSATVLGQRVTLNNVESLNVHNALAVFGFWRADGTIQATAVRDEGPYVAGATTVFLSGAVQRAEPSIGHAVVNGIKVDLTPAMAFGPVVPAVGSKLAVRGIQAVSRGVVTIDGIVGSGATANGIVGSGATANGIVGSGYRANGIVGSGATANGIVGSGYRANGIVGSGATANGIVGSGYGPTASWVPVLQRMASSVRATGPTASLGSGAQPMASWFRCYS